MTGKTGSPGVPTINHRWGRWNPALLRTSRSCLEPHCQYHINSWYAQASGCWFPNTPPKKKIHLYGILPFITGKFTCYSRRYQVSWSPPRHHQHLGQIVPFLVPQLCLFLSPLDTSSQWLGLREFYGFFIIKHGWILQTIINNMDLTWYQ